MRKKLSGFYTNEKKIDTVTRGTSSLWNAVRICYSFFFSPYFLSPDFHRAEKQRQWSIVDAIGKPSLENWGSFLGVLYRMQMICVMLTAHPENRLVHLRNWIQNTRNFPHINIDRRSFWTQISNSELVPQVGYVHHKVTKLASIVRPVGFSQQVW